MKILAVMNASRVKSGRGIIGVILNFKNQLKDSDIRYEFAINIEDDSALIACLMQNGEKFHFLPDKKRNFLRYCQALRRICAEGNFDAVHVHGSSATMALELFIAKQCRIPKRIAHCHNTQSNYPALNALLLPWFRSLYTDAVACSGEAGKRIFGQKSFTILHNAIDLERFAFSESAREECRATLGLKDGTILIGHAGSFNRQKNHAFLLQVFEDLQRRVPCELLLLGDGPFYEEIKARVRQLRMEKSVHFFGVRQDVEKWLCAMDLFLFPSLYEGLGMAAIEAQVNGLPVLASAAVPAEAKLTPSMEFLPLSESAATWAAKILEMLSAPPARILRRENFAQYDIEEEKDRLLEIYRR